MSKATDAAIERLSNPTIELYLKMMGNTETPAIMHVWSLLSAASACLTRRKWFPLGPIKVMPNQYVMLVGPPGTRKSAGIAFARRMLEDVEGLRFGPASTAGRPQGLISAMDGITSRDKEENDAFNEAMNSAGANLDFGLDTNQAAIIHTDPLNRCALYCAESELVGFLGRNMDEFITFLGHMWDCPEEHEVSLKREIAKLSFPCINIIGGITPMHITTYLPPQAIGQGFSSRVIFVYEDESKKVAWPEPIDEEMLKEFKTLMLYIFGMESGAFELEADVKATVEELYTYSLPIEDIRFEHYGMRRQSHMLKIAMALCALRASDTISSDDIRDAHELLKLTEVRMAEALGEYGLTESALARARVKRVLKAASEPLTSMRISLSCGSDVKRQEIQKAVFEMSQSNQIIEVVLKDPNGIIRTGYVWPREGNAFKRHAEVAVSYLIEETEAKKPKVDTDLLRPKQAATDLGELKPNVPEQAAPPANTHGSVAAKLAAIAAKKKEKEAD